VGDIGADAFLGTAAGAVDCTSHDGMH